MFIWRDPDLQVIIGFHKMRMFGSVHCGLIQYVKLSDNDGKWEWLKNMYLSWQIWLKSEPQSSKVPKARKITRGRKKTTEWEYGINISINININISTDMSLPENVLLFRLTTPLLENQPAINRHQRDPKARGAAEVRRMGVRAKWWLRLLGGGRKWARRKFRMGKAMESHSEVHVKKVEMEVSVDSRKC